jgi:hypothetical protein
MTSPLALSFRIDAETAAALKQLQGFQRQLQALNGIPAIPDPTAGVRTGAAATSMSLGGLLGALAAVASAATAVGAAFKAGFKSNAETESAVLGIKSLVAALTTVRDETGKVVTDTGKAIEVSGGIAVDQVKKLRIAGLQTSATFEQLLGAFQQGIGAGSSAGLALDQIRELTIGITQAAGALGMPMQQLNQEVRSLLSGDITADSTVAKALGITKKQVDAWRDAGKLADELNKRLEVFKRLGPEAGATWTATLSNVGDAISLVLGEMTKGSFDALKQTIQQGMSEVFDTATVGVADPFKGLVEAGTTAFNAIGTVLNDALGGAIGIAKDLSTWFNKNADEVAVIGSEFGVIYDSAKDILKTIISAVGAVVGWSAETGVLRSILGGIALSLALIQDGFTLMKGLAADVGGYILDKMGGAIRSVLTSIRDFVAQIPGIGSGLANAIDSTLKALPANGAGLHALAKGIQADFDAGRTAVARTNAELAKTGKELREQAAERLRESRRGEKAKATGSATGKKAPKDDKKAAEALAAAQKAFDDAMLQAAKKAADAQREVAQASLEEDLQKRLKTQEQYLRAKADLDKKAITDEVAAANTRKAQLQSQIDAEKDPAKKKKLEADMVKLKADIDALEKKGVVIDTKLRIDLEEFRRQVESLRVDIKANIMDLEGDSAGAAKARLQKETQDLLNDPRVRGDVDMEATVRRQSDLKQMRIDYDEQQRLIAARADAASRAEERIALAVDQGKMTALEAERAVHEERLKQADAILANVEALEKLAAEAPGNLELANGAAKARLEYDKLRGTLDATATSINQDLSHGAVDSFVDSLKQGESVIHSLGSALSDAFGNLAKRVLKSFEDDLFKALQGSDGQGIGGFLSGLLGGKGGFDWGKMFSSIGSFFGFATGGWTGSGGKYQPAGFVHKDEFVYTKADVGKMGGPGFFYDLKRRINRGRAMRGYAEGGLVGGGMAGVVQSFSPNFSPNLSMNPPAIFFSMDDLTRHLGRHPQFGRDVVKVYFDNQGKLQGRS